MMESPVSDDSSITSLPSLQSFPSPISSPEMMSSSSLSLDGGLFYDFDDDFSLDYNETFFSLFVGTPFKSSVQRYKDKLKKKRLELSTSMDTRKKYIKRKLRQQKTVKLRDKIAFVMGVSSLWFIPVLMLTAPQLMPAYFTIGGIVLIFLRFLLYHSKKWHYFTADLCYLINVATFAFLYIFPKSRLMFIGCFCLANGPVAWAIYAWRNSMVFHSMDKMTSIWIHVMPELTLYTVRWLSKPPYGYPLFSKNSPESTDFSFKESMLISLSMYVIWQILYYYFIIIRKSEKVLNGTRATSFTWLLADYIQNKPTNILTRIIIYVGPKYQVETFIAINFLYAVVTTAPTILFYHNFWANTAFLVTILMISIFNGADYYIEVFSRRYRQELLLLDTADVEIEETLLEATFGCVGSRGPKTKKSDGAIVAGGQGTERVGKTVSDIFKEEDAKTR